jgi:hypothetical protein
MFAAANPNETKLYKYAYRIKGQDDKKIKLVDMSSLDGAAKLSTFDCVINDESGSDISIDTSLSDICKRSEPFFFYDNGKVYYHQHVSVAIRSDHLQNITARWLLLSAATTPEAHAYLTINAGNAFNVSAQDAAKKLKGHSTTCVVINIEAFKKMIARQVTGDSAVIDIPTISVDLEERASQPRQMVPEGIGFTPFWVRWYAKWFNN